LVSTYTKQNVPVFYQMQKTINSKYQLLEQQNNRITGELKTYTSLGDEFGKLVEEYAAVRKKINEKKWEIDQLHNPND